MPRPMTVESVAVETDIPRDWLSEHKTFDSRQCEEGQYYVIADVIEIDNIKNMNSKTRLVRFVSHHDADSV